MAGQRLRYGTAIGALVLGFASCASFPLVPQVAIDGVLTGGGGRKARSSFGTRSR